MRTLPLVVALAVSACAEVRIDETSEADASVTSGPTGAGGGPSGAGGSTGTPTATTGVSDGSTAATGGGDPAGEGGSMGGGGAGGAPPDPLPVPGCEELVWAGPPSAFDARWMANPRLVPLDGGAVGLVYLDAGTVPIDAVRAVTLADPHGSWPPAVTSTVEVVTSDDFHNQPLVVHGRGDGDFSVSILHPTRVARFGVGPTGLTHDGAIIPARRAGGGAYALPHGPRVEWLPSLDAGVEPVLLGERRSLPCYDPEAITLAGGDLLVSDGPTAWCVADTVEIALASAAGVVHVASHPTPGAWRHTMVPRAGGAWLAVTYEDRVEMTPLDEQAAAVGPTWVGPKWNEPAVASWREGFAVAEYGGDEEQHGVELRVSDGEHVTFLAPDGTSWGSDGSIALVAAPDGRSVLVAQEDHYTDQVQVRRADCASR